MALPGAVVGVCVPLPGSSGRWSMGSPGMHSEQQLLHICKQHCCIDWSLHFGQGRFWLPALQLQQRLARCCHAVGPLSRSSSLSINLPCTAAVCTFHTWHVHVQAIAEHAWHASAAPRLGTRRSVKSRVRFWLHLHGTSAHLLVLDGLHCTASRGCIMVMFACITGVHLLRVVL